MDDAGSERSYLIECNTGFHKKGASFLKVWKSFFQYLISQKNSGFIFNYEKACVFGGKIFFDHID